MGAQHDHSQDRPAPDSGHAHGHGHGHGHGHHQHHHAPSGHGKAFALAVPRHIDEGAVRGFLAGQDGVSAVHDLHIWGMSTTECALTAHLVVPAGAPGDAFLRDLADELERRFRIHHATIQIETAAADCNLQTDHAH